MQTLWRAGSPQLESMSIASAKSLGFRCRGGQHPPPTIGSYYVTLNKTGHVQVLLSATDAPQATRRIVDVGARGAGEMVPGVVASVTYLRAEKLDRFNNLPAVSVRESAPGRQSGQAIAAVEQIEKRRCRPTSRMTGAARRSGKKATVGDRPRADICRDLGLILRRVRALVVAVLGAAPDAFGIVGAWRGVAPDTTTCISDGLSVARWRQERDPDRQLRL